jgi:hypothetical protein
LKGKLRRDLEQTYWPKENIMRLRKKNFAILVYDNKENICCNGHFYMNVSVIFDGVRDF